MRDTDRIFVGKTGGQIVDEIGLNRLNMRPTVQRVEDARDLGSKMIDAVLLSLGDKKVDDIRPIDIDPSKCGIDSLAEKLERVTGDSSFTRDLVEAVCRESLPFWEPLIELESFLELLGRREGVKASFTVKGIGKSPAYRVRVSFPGQVHFLSDYSVPEGWTETVLPGRSRRIAWTATFRCVHEISEGFHWTFFGWTSRLPYRKGANPPGPAGDEA